LDALAAAVAGEDWCGLEDVATGLGRLAVEEAASLLVRAWESTPHSYSRISLFQGLAGCLPAGLDDFAAEGLDDCEESVQEAACAAAPHERHVSATASAEKGSGCSLGFPDTMGEWPPCS
jgi:hypothetical protein